MSRWSDISALSNRNFLAFVGLAVLYYLFIFSFGNWWSSIAEVENDRKISDGTLGDFYSVAVVGVVIAMPAAPYLQNAFGSRIMVVVGFALRAMCFIIFCATSSSDLFAVFMVIYGFSTVVTDAALVTQGGLLEKATANRWMGVFNACAGIGGITGGLIDGALLEYASLSVGTTISILSAGILVTTLAIISFMYSYDEEITLLVNEKDASAVEDNLLVAIWYGNWERFSRKHVTHNESSPILQAQQEDEGKSEPTSRTETIELDWPGLLLLSAIASMAFFCMNAVGDWSAIYFEENWSISGAETEILGVVFEYIAVLLAAYNCDYLRTQIWNTHGMLVLGLFLASIGFGIVAIVPWIFGATTLGLVIATIGFSLSGAGIGFTMPIFFSLTGNGVLGFSLSETSAVVFTTANILGFLEPTIMGNIANATGSLTSSFASVGAAGIVLAVVCWVSPSLFTRSDDENRRRRKNSGATAQ